MTRTTEPPGRALPLRLPPPRKGPDKVVLGASLGAALVISALVAFIGLFLLVTAVPSLRRNTVSFLTSTTWRVGDAELAFGIAGMVWTTSLSSLVALGLAVPVSLGVALLITQFAPRRLGAVVGFLVDLLAAVPSVVYGIWGVVVLGPAVQPVSRWLAEHLGWFPLFAPGLASSGTVFVASLVLALMIVPIVTAISRDVFEQTPPEHIEAALALGATRWEVVRIAVLPHGRSGVIAAAMLGLGRAFGETIAVMLILSTTNDTRINVSLFAGGETFASRIANNAAEFDSALKTGAYIAAGLVLFLITFAVNALARVIAAGGRRAS